MVHQSNLNQESEGYPYPRYMGSQFSSGSLPMRQTPSSGSDNSYRSQISVGSYDLPSSGTSEFQAPQVRFNHQGNMAWSLSGNGYQAPQSLDSTTPMGTPGFAYGQIDFTQTSSPTYSQQPCHELTTWPAPPGTEIEYQGYPYPPVADCGSLEQSPFQYATPPTVSGSEIQIQPGLALEVQQRGHVTDNRLAVEQFRNGKRSKTEFACDVPNCASAEKKFSRAADLHRHKETVHNPNCKKLDCVLPDCPRKGDKGFKRRDHMVDHLRGVHQMDIAKRPPHQRRKPSSAKN